MWSCFGEYYSKTEHGIAFCLLKVHSALRKTYTNNCKYLTVPVLITVLLKFMVIT